MKVCPQCNLQYDNEKTNCFIDARTLVPLEDPRLGTLLRGRYKLEAIIGEGGMATVYRARYLNFDRLCAIKILNEAAQADPVTTKRFRREAKATQKLSHPNIIEIYEEGETPDGAPFMAMELLKGEPLADRLGRGRLSLEESLPITLSVARALARAHDLEVLHRDLKPENVFIESPDGRVVLLDFGIARSMADPRLTAAGDVFGTPQYMAPERVNSIDHSPAVDLYSLGVMLFELLAGQLPFDGEDIVSVFVKHINEPVPNLLGIDPSLPKDLVKLTEQLLQKDPADRPVDAHEVVQIVTRVMGALGIRLPENARGLANADRGPAKTLPPAGVDQWALRLATFERMVQKAFPTSPPPALSHELKVLQEHLTELRKVSQESLDKQRKLQKLETSGREGRDRFGRAVHQLGLDASHARQNAKQAFFDLRQRQAQSEELKKKTNSAAQAVKQWEERSRFETPYLELARAYGDAASLMGQWTESHNLEEKASVVWAAKQAEVADVEYQIQELRKALGEHERQSEDKTAQCQQELADLGARTAALNTILLEHSSALCESLRGTPGLASLFSELETDTVARA